MFWHLKRFNDIRYNTIFVAYVLTYTDDYDGGGDDGDGYDDYCYDCYCAMI